ncbi:tryptophan halogenase [Phenylobacterium hankyongense]|uniref:Tryptophan halogenase n=1 Tax=Phenylobacterium hankyongense TaxID=1813876 RepID=A0A328AX95_9CAUL|nr:tryptophan 7-halogenase [Phenylobacterium hankyongense]RAK58326.1 tryptophan halogenase [Phenylobacterium hankyongense]
MSAPLTEVVVVGRDAALWLAASVIQAALRPGVRVTAVELPSRLCPADVYASLPALEAFHNLLQLDEAQLLRLAGGSFSLGQNFQSSGGAGPSFFHAYGSYGAAIDHKDFFAYWLKARSLGLSVALEDFSLTAAAAKQGRMLLPDETTERFGRTDYGYHLPALAYASVLKTLAVRHGVTALQTDAAHAVLDPDSGDILALDLAGGRRVEGQFFLDASGAEGCLIAGVLGVGREDWRSHFVADRTLVARAAPYAAAPVYAELRAWEAGWVGLFPTQAATHIVQAYSSAYCDDGAALVGAAKVAQLDLDDAVVRRADPGRRLVAWARNCVALGEAACLFDATHAVELHAVQLGLVHLLELFPLGGAFAVERQEYNRITQSAFERIRDFQSAFYVLNRYGDSEFWSAARRAPASPELTHKIETFAARGEATLLEDETFLIDSWRALFVGQGLMPGSHIPIIDQTSPEEVKREFRRILGFIKEQVLKQPSHQQYLDRLCRREKVPEIASGS